MQGATFQTEMELTGCERTFPQNSGATSRMDNTERTEGHYSDEDEMMDDIMWDFDSNDYYELTGTPEIITEYEEKEQNNQAVNSEKMEIHDSDDYQLMDEAMTETTTPDDNYDLMLPVLITEYNGENDENNNENKQPIDSGKTKRRETVFEKTSIDAVLNSRCGCERDCIDFLNYDLVLSWRKKYHSLPMGKRQQVKLIELYKETLFTEGRLKTLHVVEGNLICRTAWIKLLGISLSTYTRAKRFICQDIYPLIPLGKNEDKTRAKGNIALGFMKHYVSIVGDHQPESGRILLPIGIYVKDVYLKYVTHHTNHISKSAFYSIWKKNMKHVSRQKYASRVAMCKVCFFARELLQQNLSPVQEKKVLSDREEHLKRQRAERESYYERRESAVADPGEKMSIILDGMDQSKTNIPHFSGWVVPKDCDTANLLQTHVVGGEVHGRKVHLLLDVLQWPHDSNLTLSSLLWILKRNSEDGMLKKTIYIQLDNCARENKNKYFLGMMAYLVKQGYVENIILSFLMVGHTHEDIDARFSRISKQLRNKHAATFPVLFQMMAKSVTDDKMEPTFLPAVFNVKEWLEPYLSAIRNHSQPHVYRIFIDRPNHVTVKYKHWSTDPEWSPKPSEPQLEIFKLDNLGRQEIPHGQPNPVTPNLEQSQNMLAIAGNIKRLAKYLTEAENDWWENFLNDPLSFVCDDSTDWYLNSIKQTEDNTNELARPIDANTTSPLGLVMTKERSMPQVYTGTKSNQITPSAETQQTVENGCMVLYIEDGEPNIAKIIGITGDDVQLTLYQGQLNGLWKPALTGANEEMTTIVGIHNLKNEYLFYLTRTDRLPGHIRNVLKQFMQL